MDVTSLNLMALTDAEILQLRGDVEADIARRTVLNTAEEQAQELSEAWYQASGRKPGDPWSQPRGAHDAYPPGAVVTDKGQAYRNDHPGPNGWKPGDVGASWTPVWPDGEGGWTTTPPAEPDGGPAAWMAGVAYKPGNRVTHDGKVWECLLAHTSHDGWKPSAHTHAVWKPIA